MGSKSTYGVVRSLAIYYGQFWRHNRLKNFYGQFIAPGQLAFDIGSHVGNRTKAWRKLGARVVAVEPQPTFQKILQMLFAKDPHVFLERCGIAAQSGVATLYVSSQTPTVSSCSSDWVEDAKKSNRFSNVHWDQEVQVTMLTLEDLIEKYGIPVFCKIDIEGGEEEALAGLRTPLPTISFECLGGTMSRRGIACIDRLDQLGHYQYRYSQLETMKWSSSTWLTSNQIKAQLRSFPKNGPAGDIYARLIH